MVKAISYTVAAILFCIGLFLFSEFYVTEQFDQFSQALDSLYTKVEDGSANREDGYAVRSLWNEKKSRLHLFVPHNDISYIDYWLSETCGFLYTGQYELALGNIEVLQEITRNLPGAYRLRMENIL